MQSSSVPTRDWASEAFDCAVFAVSSVDWFSAFVANLTSSDSLFCVTLELISSVTPSLVAYLPETSLVILSCSTVMSDFVARPLPSAPS